MGEGDGTEGGQGSSRRMDFMLTRGVLQREVRA